MNIRALTGKRNTKANPMVRKEILIGRDLALTLFIDHEVLSSQHLNWARNLASQVTPVERLSPLGLDMARALAVFEAGEIPQWPDPVLDWGRVGPFARKVLETLQRDVGYGETISYGELAALAGSPGAARAVGRTMANTPWSMLFPCHRVTGARGKLLGFGSCGVEMQEFLLRLEGTLE